MDKELARFSATDRLDFFDEATRRQRERELKRPIKEVTDRGWIRDSLYKRNAGVD